MSNEVIEHPTQNSNQEPNSSLNENEHRKYTLIVYGLYAFAFLVGGLSAVVGVIIAYIKRNEAYGTVDYSHLQYLIRTFWIAAIGLLVGSLLTLILIGWLVLDRKSVV